MLQGLQKLEILSYLPKTDAPQVELLQPRVDYKNLFIDSQFIQERKKIKQQQLEAIDNYLDTEHCRSVALQGYFGEKDVPPCGTCDLCLMRIHAEGMTEKIETEIRTLLTDKKMDVKSLIDAIETGNDEARLRVVRSLVDSEFVQVEEGMYSWNVSKY